MTRQALAVLLAFAFALVLGVASEPRGLAAQDAPLRAVELATGGAAVSDDARTVRIIALHPWGGSARSFARALAPDELGCRARWSFVEGPYREPPGRAWFRRRALDPDQAALAREVRARVDQLTGLVAVPAGRQRPRTIVAGYSEGAMLALAFGALRPESADAVVAASGALPRELWPASPPRSPAFAIVHGRDDWFVPFGPTEALARQLRAVLTPVDAGHRFRGALRRGFRDSLRAALEGNGACGG